MHLVFDFDGTIATHDTLGALVKGAARWQCQRGRADSWPKWEGIEQQYFKEYADHKSGYSPQEVDRLTLDEETQFLAASMAVEEASIQRVHDLGVFRDLDRDSLRQVGREALRNGDIVIRAGFRETLALAKAHGWKTSVLSINWSQSFLQGILETFDENGELEVVANEIHAEDGTIRGPDMMEGTRMSCSPHKLSALRKIVGGASEANETVYYGDSTTDLECILFCTGVVMTPQPETSSLLKTLRRLGWNVAHASSTGPDTTRLCWATDFAAVLDGDVLKIK